MRGITVKCWNGIWIPDDEGMRDRTNPADTKGLEYGQIDMVLEHVKERRVCLQGGARVGIWPLALSRKFDRVIAFEPHPDNVACCELNFQGHDNIEFHPVGLWNKTGVQMLTESRESGGEHYMATGAASRSIPVKCVAIDDLRLPVLDAMFLDVEGAEYIVLQGAQDTIARCKPVICLEENILVSRYRNKRGHIEAWLGALFGYARVAEWTTLPPEVQATGFRGSDLIFAPR